VDFRVPGVTSLSADVHKYGYAFKGASVILYRDPAMVQRQWFLFDDWPGGLYGSATTAGTRPAAPIAGAWATIRHLGSTATWRRRGWCATPPGASSRASRLFRASP